MAASVHSIESLGMDCSKAIAGNWQWIRELLLKLDRPFAVNDSSYHFWPVPAEPVSLAIEVRHVAGVVR